MTGVGPVLHQRLDNGAGKMVFAAYIRRLAVPGQNLVKTWSKLVKNTFESNHAGTDAVMLAAGSPEFGHPAAAPPDLHLIYT